MFFSSFDRPLWFRFAEQQTRACAQGRLPDSSPSEPARASEPTDIARVINEADSSAEHPVNTPSTNRMATTNITGRRTTGIEALMVHTRKLRTGREQP